ncbi:MAG: energy-coupling factor transporter transmembrane protein EcfT [Clostridiales bacterium]|nr:energy-coupling factor transporter transmembrane protein EcfT [Clostridiales bacterium]
MNSFESGKGAFAGFHPVIIFLYFAYVVLITILLLQPVFLVIAFTGAMLYSFLLRGRPAARFNFGLVLPLMAVCVVLNPLFNHQGVTILTYLGYNPITLESVLYGACAALMIGAVLLWFSCYTAIVSSDKFLWLFGRVIPAVALIFSMTLGFFPRYQAQAKRTAAARRGLGFDGLSGRIRSGGRILSALVTWALENAIETSDSMRARGYGLPGRTTYSNERFDGRDGVLFPLLCALIAVTVIAAAAGALQVQYFPAFQMRGAAYAYAVHAVLCFLPSFLEIRERLLFRALRGRIPANQGDGFGGASRLREPQEPSPWLAGSQGRRGSV